MYSGVGAGLAWTAARVTIPSLAGAAIDRGIIGSDSGLLTLLALLILALGAFSAACGGFRRYAAFKVAYSVETEWREGMFANLQRLDFSFHDHAQTGQLMARGATDLQQVNQLVVMVPLTMANLLTIVSVMVILLIVNVPLALIAMASVPVINLSAKRFSNRIHPVSMELQEELSGLSTVVEETVTGIRAVKGLGAEAIQLRQLSRQAGRIYDRIIDLARIRAFFLPLLDVLPVLSLAVILWYGGVQVLHHHLSVGQLTEFNLYVVMLVNPLRTIGMVVAQSQRAVASTQRVKLILDAAPVIKDDPHSVPLPPGSGDVRFSSVSFSYGAGSPPVLSGFDFHVAPAESVALVGATGSGKSTIARLLPRFYDPDAGQIELDGTDIRRIRLHDLRRCVATVFEDTFLFTDSVRGNIAFADPEASLEQVVQAAQLAGAHEFIVDLPDGYDTLLGERGFSLSGGQRQRLALARAILADPRVLVLDDATSSVDATKEHEIRAALSQVMAGRTTIVITHRPATIALAQRVVLLDKGRIVASGTHDELVTTSERYRQVLAQGAALDAERVHTAASDRGGDSP
ncbi:MAG TPA: ABC transporter ATP-binding protein [Acidimicrobiales bacterium]|nr:ABC transporter ATP-binding protein [Acidimicrobiales bacterium]